MMWVLVHLDEVESDLSVFHRIDDIRTVPSSRFYRLAERLPYYDGAVRRVLTVALNTQPERPALSIVGSQATAAPVMDAADLAAMSGPNDQGIPWIEYRGRR